MAKNGPCGRFQLSDLMRSGFLGRDVLLFVEAIGIVTERADQTPSVGWGECFSYGILYNIKNILNPRAGPNMQHSTSSKPLY